MSEGGHDVYPTEINLHSKSRILSLTFSDGAHFDLPCEYLRVYSRAAEVKTSERPEVGKEHVNIDRIEPQGSYAVRLVFDDGHDTGIYSWSSLYDLGANYERYWNDYLARLDAIGYVRGSGQSGSSSDSPRKLRVLYFAYLVPRMRKEAEDVQVPADVGDVQGLLAWLRRRDREKAYLLADDNVRVTVNKQFAEPFTRLDPGDEVGIVPVSPTPPSPPRTPGRAGDGSA